MLAIFLISSHWRSVNVLYSLKNDKFLEIFIVFFLMYWKLDFEFVRQFVDKLPHNDKVLIMFSKYSTCKQPAAYWGVISETKPADNEFQADIPRLLSNDITLWWGAWRL